MSLRHPVLCITRKSLCTYKWRSNLIPVYMWYTMCAYLICTQTCIHDVTHTCCITHTSVCLHHTYICYITHTYVTSHIHMLHHTYICDITHTCFKIYSYIDTPPKNGDIALRPNTRVVKCKYLFHKRQPYNMYHPYRFQDVLVYWHTTRVPGLGQITWWIMKEKKLRGRSGKKNAPKSRNSCAVNDQDCGCIGTVDSRRNFAQS